MLYDFECRICGNKTEEYFKVDDRPKSLPCPSCGTRNGMRQIFSSSYGISMNGVPAGGYFDESLGTYVNSVAQKRRLMKEQGVHEKFGKGWR
jgi:putative FmdB family regulatory protein